MAILDLVENSCIAMMLWMWTDLSHGLVECRRVKIVAEGLTELIGVPAVIANPRGREA